MAWARLDDKMHDHPKVLECSFAALGVWTVALSWSADRLTDGFIPTKYARTREFPNDCIKELVARGMWDVVEGGWQIHDYIDFNPSKADVLAEREATRKRVNKHRDRRARRDAPVGNTVTERVSNAVTNTVTERVTNTVRNAERNAFCNAPPIPLNSSSSETSSLDLKPISLVCASSSESDAQAHTHEVARFIKPVGEAPPGTEPSEGQSLPWVKVWKLYERHENREGMLGLPHRFRDALQAIAAAAEVESGESAGVAFENAVQRLLGAWKADKFVREKQPSIKNLADNLHRYSRPKTVAKAVVYEESREERWLRENREAEERHQERLKNPGPWALKAQELMAARAAKENAS